ncbi:MAG: TraB/GumN family protein [Desulfobacterales bacterium]|nr:TraB/GumN family protein [Desulfobacterales bacterium]
MKKFIMMILCLFLLTTTIYAESSVWQLKSDNSKFYIAGSFHALKKSDYPLPTEFETAYKNSEQLVFETYINEISKMETQSILMSKALYNGDETLAKQLSKKAYESLKKYCDTRGFPVENFAKFKPWMVAMALATLEMQKNGINFSDGMDLYFNNKANQDGKPSLGLVSVKEHIDIISSFGDELNDFIIENFIKEMDELVKFIEDLKIAWKTGNEEQIDKYVSGRLREEYPKLYKLIISDRNQKWLGTVENFIKTGKNTMVIVGAGHLVGQDSLIKLLAQKGYKFEKLK